MATNKALTCGNAPLSAALLRERLDEVFVKLRQQVDAVVDSVGAASLSPHSFEALSAGLRSATDEAGLALLVKVVKAADVSAQTIEKDGRSLRFRGQSPKQWLTRFGIATVKRRYYASDEGEGCVVPLDALCGMTERFMTPDVEEMVAFACSAMTPCEVEQILKKALPAAPSATAIKRTIRDVGGFLEEHRDKVEEVVQSKVEDAAQRRRPLLGRQLGWRHGATTRRQGDQLEGGGRGPRLDLQ